MKQRIKRSSAPDYASPNQLTMKGIETPFKQSLNPKNWWIVLVSLIPWDEICNGYLKHARVSSTGRPPINPHVVIGSIIIKQMCNLDDWESVDQISETFICSTSRVIKVLPIRPLSMLHFFLSSVSGLALNNSMQ